MKALLLFLLPWLLCFSCGKNHQADDLSEPFIVVLGIAQDGGFPHAGCEKACCASAWKDPDLKRHVTCLGIVDPSTSQCWIIDATPDFPHQLHMLQNISGAEKPLLLAGILLTHAHMGHYTGLMYLGRESMHTRSVSVYAMPRMRTFLETNGPWNQLVDLKNIQLHTMKHNSPVRLTEHITVIPFLVPHRDEYSETVGFEIIGPNSSCLLIPDIDKWQRWEIPIEDLIRTHDIAFLDGTFYSNAELPGRNMSEIPHPFIIESLNRFQSLTGEEKKKIHFLHLNHTNPVLQKNSPTRDHILHIGFRVAREMQCFPL